MCRQPGGGSLHFESPREEFTLYAPAVIPSDNKHYSTGTNDHDHTQPEPTRVPNGPADQRVPDPISAERILHTHSRCGRKRRRRLHQQTLGQKLPGGSRAPPESRHDAQ